MKNKRSSSRWTCWLPAPADLTFLKAKRAVTNEAVLHDFNLVQDPMRVGMGSILLDRLGTGSELASICLAVVYTLKASSTDHHSLARPQP